MLGDQAFFGNAGSWDDDDDEGHGYGDIDGSLVDSTTKDGILCSSDSNADTMSALAGHSGSHAGVLDDLMHTRAFALLSMRVCHPCSQIQRHRSWPLHVTRMCVVMEAVL